MMEMASVSETTPVSSLMGRSLRGNENVIMRLCFILVLWQNSYTFPRPNYTGAR
jgi:hypothetical protein